MATHPSVPVRGRKGGRIDLHTGVRDNRGGEGLRGRRVGFAQGAVGEEDEREARSWDFDSACVGISVALHRRDILLAHRDTIGLEDTAEGLVMIGWSTRGAGNAG